MHVFPSCHTPSAIRQIFIAVVLVLTGCRGAVQQVIPTALPTITPTFTASPTETPNRQATPVVSPTRRIAFLPTTGPSPTPLLAPSSTALPIIPTPTRIFNPNAPRIEFFTSDLLAVEPGGQVTLFWAARGVDNAVIYRLDDSGERTQVWNVAPDSSLTVSTNRADRVNVSFVLGVGEGPLYIEESLTLPIRCPIEWFFSPAPEDCPDAEADETNLVEQPLERGRMIYVASRSRIYVLFNDGQNPAWLSFPNQYNPEVHPESEANFIPPPGLYQPLAQLGFLWRNNDTVRNRLGLGIQEQRSYLGFIQTSTLQGNNVIYISSADGAVLQIVPGGQVWTLIGSR